MYILSALLTVCGSFLFKVKMTLNLEDSKDNEDNSIGDTLKNILLKIFENHWYQYLVNSFLGKCNWILFKKKQKKYLDMLSDFADIMISIVKGIIKFTPIGIMRLEYNSVSYSSIKIFYDYRKLILLDIHVF